AGSTFASDVGQSRATVNAQVDTGSGLTLYRFEYGTDASYGSRTPPGGPIDPEGADQMATATIEEHAPGTTYHYRGRLTNCSGSSVGPDHTFTTPSLPVIASTSASAVGQTSATLGALINPSLSLTTYRFEYGTSTAYGASTPEAAAGSGGAALAVSSVVTGLAPGTTYHYRVVADNGVGGAIGNDQTFTTGAATPPPSKPAQPK